MDPLKGTELLDETVKIGEQDIPAARVVAGAFEKAELDVEAWNALDDEQRKSHIDAYLAALANVDTDDDEDSVGTDPAATEGAPDNRLDGSVKDILAGAANYSDDELRELIAAEQGGKNRVSLVRGLSELLSTAGGGKADRGEEIPDWKKPDYTGPLTGEQAMWRNQHITTK